MDWAAQGGSGGLRWLQKGDHLWAGHGGDEAAIEGKAAVSQERDAKVVDEKAIWTVGER